MTGLSDFERLYRESGDRLWWALFAYAGDQEIASDATAEAFARALATPAAIRDPAAWVWRVAFRVATAELRAQRRRGRTPKTSYEMDERALAVIVALAGCRAGSARSSSSSTWTIGRRDARS